MTMPQVRSPRRLRRPLVIGGLAVLILSVTAGTVWLTFALNKNDFSFGTTLPAGSNVRVSAGNLDVHFHPATDGKVHVQAHGTYRGNTPHVDARAESGGVVVDASCQSGFGFLNLGLCSISVDVDLPTDNAVSVTNTNGNLSADSLTASVSLVTTNGDIKASGLSGDVIMRTESGDVTGDGLRSSSVTATSSNGDETLGFTAVPTTVNAHTSNGDVIVRTPGGTSYHVETETDTGDVHVTVPRDDASKHVITASTSNGDVTVQDS